VLSDRLNVTLEVLASLSEAESAGSTEGRVGGLGYLSVVGFEISPRWSNRCARRCYLGVEPLKGYQFYVGKDVLLKRLVSEAGRLVRYLY